MELSSPGRVEYKISWLWTFKCLNSLMAVQYFILNKMKRTVDGRNPTPPGMYRTLQTMGVNYLSIAVRFLPSTVKKNNFHEPANAEIDS